MPKVVFHADFEVDYQAQRGTPLCRSLDVEVAHEIDFTIAASPSPEWQHVHIEHIGELSALVVCVDKPVYVRLNNQASAEFTIGPTDATPYGVLALVDCAIDAGPGLNVNVKPVNGNEAVALFGFAGGTAAAEADGEDGYGDGGFGEDGYGA